ncbi:lysophospholipase [Nitriliruptoraceae bacterium ZYF776]|nr:lysophospholipase [Profundirhabdus halotolerans]
MAEAGRARAGRVRLPRAPRRRAGATAALTDRRRRVATVAGGGAAALLALAGSATWYYAERITEPPHRRPPTPLPQDAVEVLARRGDHVVLRGPQAARPGWWGIDLPRGYLRVGPPVTPAGREGEAGPDDAVARPVELAAGAVAPGEVGRFDADAVPDDPGVLGLPVEEVVVQGPLGGMPAWWFPTDDPAATACVLVHGRSGSRREGLRWVPTLIAAGVPTLVVSYRNDREAPPSPDGRSHLGATEWEDVAAGLRFVLDRQAAAGSGRDPEALLFGISMGGACAAELLARSDLARHVRGLVLDAPVRHWGPVLRAAAAQRGLPPAVLPVLLPPTMALAGARGRIDWRGLDHLDDPARFSLPTLLFHGDADLTVPVALSDAFAQRRRDVVTYVRVPGAGHVRTWNTDRAGCEAALAAYLGEVTGAGARR